MRSFEKWMEWAFKNHPAHLEFVLNAKSEFHKNHSSVYQNAAQAWGVCAEDYGPLTARIYEWLRNVDFYGPDHELLPPPPTIN